jgi:hypothetical protein
METLRKRKKFETAVFCLSSQTQERVTWLALHVGLALIEVILGHRGDTDFRAHEKVHCVPAAGWTTLFEKSGGSRRT